jgi:16S rRNA U1498 N3-methylase RsmE
LDLDLALDLALDFGVCSEPKESDFAITHVTALGVYKIMACVWGRRVNNTKTTVNIGHTAKQTTQSGPLNATSQASSQGTPLR